MVRMDVNIRKIIRQGGSHMISIPPGCLKEKNLKRGDFIKFNPDLLVKVEYVEVEEKSKQNKLNGEK